MQAAATQARKDIGHDQDSGTSRSAADRVRLAGHPGIGADSPLHIRAALGYHQLDEYADDAVAITSELVSNAIQHACGDGTETVGVTLARIRNPDAVTVVVTDSSPVGPVRREPSHSSERGRGLLVVEELSVHWGWNPEDGGKAVYAVLTKKASG